MAGQNIKDSINKTKEFMQLWMKFHDIYREAMNKSAITAEEEAAFLETKSIIARKFQTLAESISIDRYTIDRTYEVINQILSLKSISTLAEQTSKKIENDWHESYISLNRLLGHLEAQKDKDSQEKGSGFKALGGLMKFFISFGVVAVFALLVLYLAYILGLLK